MKRIRSIIIILLLVAVGLFFWRRHKPNSETATVAPASAETASAESPAAAMSLPASAFSPAMAEKPASTQSDGKRERMSNLLSAVNHKPIEFYGKVIDQFGVPIPAVDVYVSVIYNNGLSAGVDKKQTTTDAAGFFSISGMKGRTLGVGLDKNGYEYGGDHGPFQYTEMVPESERYYPDPKSPVVFVMSKLQGAESMLYFERRWYDLRPDGAPMQVNLATGKKVSEGGDLIISLKQPLDQSGKRLLHYAWTAQIMAAGLQESMTKLMYLAPEGGYMTVLTYGETGDERVQSNQVTKSFFVKTSDGRFARVRMDLTTQTNPEFPGTVGLTWWLNPKVGSRNLEYEPASPTVLPSRIKPVPDGNIEATPKP